MPNTWFRMYAEFAHDPKVQMLSEAIQRRYVMLLCMRCGNDHVTLHETEVAFQLRISEQEWMETKAILLDKGLITEDNRPSAWDKRQFASDSSAERVARHRAKKKQDGNDDEKQGNEACNVTVTPQIQIQRQKRVNPLPSVGGAGGDASSADDPAPDASPSAQPAEPKAKASRGSRLPPEWKLPKAWGDWALAEQPTWNAEHVRKIADTFRDFWQSKAGKDAAKLDWEATWRVWVRKEPALRSAPVPERAAHLAGCL